jgi:hypothetical protein
VQQTPPKFRIVLRGYERSQVDALVARAIESGPAAVRVPPAPNFTIVLRGYDRRQVDEYLVTLAGSSGVADSTPTSLAAPDFTLVSYGYDISQVERFVARALSRIAELERMLERRAEPPGT